MAEGVMVVGWFVSPIIKELIDKAKSYVASQYKWLSGTTVQLELLARALTQLQATAGAIERRGPKDTNQVEWLNQLKDAVHKAEDVLDEFDYQILESSLTSDRKVYRILSSSLKLSKRLIGKGLDSINNSSERLIQVVELETGGSSRPAEDTSDRITSSVLTEDKVFGRQKERDEILRRLTTESAIWPQSSGQYAPVVAIVGDGGTGKTTLAQLIYNDSRVERHFGERMWVCVSDRFDKIKLTKEILQSANDKMHEGVTNFNVLQMTLKAKVMSRRFLLVLDDVWIDKEKTDWENGQRWRELLAPFRHGEQGSKILMTTRMKIVAEIMNAREPIFMKGLQSDDCWWLFKKCALGDENTDAFPQLQEIGKKIAAKLNGSPLAAKAVGGLLRYKRSTREWNEILDRENYSDINSTLILSYQYLPEHLQPCFAYCSIFPRNWKFNPKKLVKMWMSQGFIMHANGIDKRAEDIGMEYFYHLLSWSFFQVLKQGNRPLYFMHDLMHDLARTVSTNECIRIESPITRSIPPTIRHLSVTSDSLAQLTNQCRLERLRTLLIIKSSSFTLDHLQEDLFAELKSIRALDLTGCSITALPENIGHLMHLRYLALCDTLKELPKSLSKLLHLQVLNLPKRCQLNKIPEGMGQLISLRHLDIDSKYTSMIVDIGRLINLQGSVEFHVKRDGRQNLEQLKSMNDLREQLSIKNLDNVLSMEEASKAELTKKQYVKVLKLEWSSARRSLLPVVDDEVLGGLEPHQNLKELHITRYRGASSPTWLDSRPLCQLKSIYLTNCRKWEVLPPLGQLGFLEVLHIKEMYLVRQIGHEFYGSNTVAFPSLKDLQLDDMPRCVEWSGEANGDIFPRLQKLKLSNCPNLTKVPLIPPTVMSMTLHQIGVISQLKLFHVTSSQLITFSLDTSATNILHGLLHPEHLKAIDALNIRCCKEPVMAEDIQVLNSLKKLKISQCAITDEHLSRCLLHLDSLSTLEMADCHNITSLLLPKEESSSRALQEVHIQGCQKLTSLAAIKTFISLKSLIIERCPRLTSASLPADLNNLPSLKTLSISYCPELQLLPEYGLPSSLELLLLIGCHPVLTQQLSKKKGPEWEKIARVPKVVIR
ncbi:putative disease resistance RPP13-like protein 1 [Typha angustifolia]|uniref:putative disease resistance RPP13-like protein 1 n=1 Tax=Typha angustifolia TaxID=59011 RepID=UPI003C2FF62E